MIFCCTESFGPKPDVLFLKAKFPIFFKTTFDNATVSQIVCVNPEGKISKTPTQMSHIWWQNVSKPSSLHLQSTIIITLSQMSRTLSQMSHKTPREMSQAQWFHYLGPFWTHDISMTSVASAVGPRSSIDFSFQNLVFWNLFEFQWQKSLQNQYLPHSESKSYQIISIKSCSSRSFQQHQRHNSSEIFNYDLI